MGLGQKKKTKTDIKRRKKMQKKISIGEALRNIKDMAEHINDLIEKRQQSAWGFEEDEKTDIIQLTNEINEEARNLAVLKTTVMSKNLSIVVTSHDKLFNLMEANLRISFLKKEINHLKTMLKDPNKEPIGRFYAHISRKKEDILSEPKFDKKIIEVQIQEHKEELSKLDVGRTSKNFSTMIEVSLE